MKRNILLFCLTALFALSAPAQAKWKGTQERTFSGFGHPESVAYDPSGELLYVSRFGPELKPAQKDGKGYISLVDLNGNVLQERFLPGKGNVLNKPKGIWVSSGRLWTTDIDSVWVFDLKTKEGRRIDLPGAVFANDVVAYEGDLYVSDTAAGTVFLIRPADFLSKTPEISAVIRKKGLSPNGLWIMDNGQLLIATSPREGPGGMVYAAGKSGNIEAITPALGRLDGLAELPEGTLLYTDWAGNGLFAKEKDGNPYSLSSQFEGPADFAIMPKANGYFVVVPDLVKGELRVIELMR